MEKLLIILNKVLTCVYELIDEVAKDNILNISEKQYELKAIVSEINELNNSQEFSNEIELRKAMEIFINRLKLKLEYTTKSDFSYYSIIAEDEINEEEFEILSKFIEVIK